MQWKSYLVKSATERMPVFSALLSDLERDLQQEMFTGTVSCRQLQICCRLLLRDIYLTIWVKSGLYILHIMRHLLVAYRGRQHPPLQHNFFVDFSALEDEDTAVLLTLVPSDTFPVLLLGSSGNEVSQCATCSMSVETGLSDG